MATPKPIPDAYKYTPQQRPKRVHQGPFKALPHSPGGVDEEILSSIGMLVIT